MQQLAQQFQQMQGTQGSQMQQATGVDAGSQAYVDQMRQHALGGIGQLGAGNFAPSVEMVNSMTGQLQSPFREQVLGGLGQQFDQLRGQAGVAANQGATAAGAFGGSRHGVAQGQRMAELDRAQMQQAGQLMNQNFGQAQQNAMGLAQQQAAAPAQALMAQQQMLQGGLGPTGQVTSGAQQSQQQQLMNALNQMSGSQNAMGGQTAQSNLRGKTVNQQDGNLFGDLLGGALTLGGLGGFGALGSLFGLGGIPSTPNIQHPGDPFAPGGSGWG